MVMGTKSIYGSLWSHTGQTMVYVVDTTSSAFDLYSSHSINDKIMAHTYMYMVDYMNAN